jgi:glycosyltransferase involved in cell wall biosynthesis
MSCAFTQKNRKLAKMLTSLGHEVFFYGAEGSDVEEYVNSPNLHFIQTHTLKDIRDDYGEGDNRFEIGYDWTNSDYRHDFNNTRKPSTLKFYQTCIEYINKVKKPDDFLLATQGQYHRPIANEVKLFLTCESGIGYRGSASEMYRCFESSYIQNFTYGSEHPFASLNGSYYDRVIPNYFDPDDVEYSDKKGDYYLFIGRMIKRKGIMSAALSCNAIGKKLIIVGQGASVVNGHLIPNEDPDFDLPPMTWEYQGYADVEKRKDLMAHAIATFTPTEYLECFGGTHVESLLAGTPPITTDFGVYPTTLPDYFANGKVGFRCNTLQDFVDASLKAATFGKDDYRRIRDYGERFLMDSVKYDYQKWFDDLHNVWESTDGVQKGWSRVSNY